MKSDLIAIDNICNKDAVRTFKVKSLFNSPEAPGTQLIFNICKALGAYYPKAGYCQGILKKE
jgi:hypothetical protein